MKVWTKAQASKASLKLQTAIYVLSILFNLLPSKPKNGKNLELAVFTVQTLFHADWFMIKIYEHADKHIHTASQLEQVTSH